MENNPPYIEITEQPACCSLRFRYESEVEGRRTGIIVGVNSTPEKKTYPTIKVNIHFFIIIIISTCIFSI